MSNEEPRTLPEGDFDSRADKLWSVYNKEAESYDRALMETWRDDMDSIIIFAGLFSAVLTAFLVDASQKLAANPSDETNALLRQILAQNSQQLGPNGSQIIISLPGPFEPHPSDVRVNLFWFMSLAFSLIAALGATLVQQWVRDYLQIFQRFSGSLERSRMRQFLFHGLASNNMHMLVNFIPACIHISLFLFFIGLTENLFSCNTTIAIVTVTIIGSCVLFYFACSIFPALYTKTPYHTPLSSFFWKIRQMVHPLSYKNDSGKIVPVSSDMTKGHLQLAMGHSDDRMVRDTEAMHWVLTKITEDSEFKPFFSSIGGSLATSWGIDVWMRVFRESPGKANLTRSGTIITPDAVQVLKIRIESLLRSCTDSTADAQARFTSVGICINAAASLMLGFETGLKLDVNNNIMNPVLRYFGEEAKRRDKLVQEDISLEIKWKCLVLIGMKKAFKQESSQLAFPTGTYEKYMSSEDYRIVNGKTVTRRGQKVDNELLKAWGAARQLYSELHHIPEEQLTEVRLRELVPCWRDYIETMQSSLDELNLHVHRGLDSAAVYLNESFIRATHGSLKHLEDILSEWPSMVNLVTTQQMFEDMFEGVKWARGTTDPLWLMPHLIPPRLLIFHLLVCADSKRRPNFDPSMPPIDLVGLRTLINNPEMQRLFDPQHVDDQEQGGLKLRGPQPYVNQFWRVRDIDRHEGVGFMIEMFFATFRSLDEQSLSAESKQMIKATLDAIVNDADYGYLKIADQRFLWALRQELPKVVDMKQTAHTSLNPGRKKLIVFLLEKLVFDVIDRHQLELKEESLFSLGW